MAVQSKAAVGWVGLGAMGFGMATHLVKQGYEVTAFDIFPQSLERFQAAGGKTAKSLHESATGKPIYVCMVASAVQLNELMFHGKEALIKAIEKGATFLVASTVAASDIQEFQSKLNEYGRGDIYLVDCPVSGGAKRAANGTLSIMAAGSADALSKADQILRDMSDDDKLFFPGDIGQGSNLKMVHQVLAAIQIATVSEALAFASWCNLDLEEVRAAVMGPESHAYSWMFENRSPRTIANQLTPPESALTIILKDTGIITKSARQQRYPAPMCTTAEQVYLLGLCQGFGPEDDATLARVYMPQLKPPSRSPAQANEDAEIGKAAMQMVLILMEGIHTVAAAEAVGFASDLGLDPGMVMKLVNDAAGASWAFREYAPGMFSELTNQGTDELSAPLKRARYLLSVVVEKARSINFPLFLGNTALDTMTKVERTLTTLGIDEPRVVDLVRYYIARP